VWSTLFRVRQNLKGSLLVLPLLGALTAVLFGALTVRVDQSVSLPSDWQYSPSTASTVLAAIVGATAALTGFVVTVTVLVVQMATGTFSARYMRLFYRDRMQKAVLAVLVGTLTFSFALLRRVESDFVPNLGVTIAGALVVVSLLLFVFFLDRFIHRLRPVVVAALVARAGRRAFEETAGAAAPEAAPVVSPPAGPPTLVVRSRAGGAIQAIDSEGLVRWAREHDCLLVLAQAVGDFVPAGAPLVEVHGTTSDPLVAETKLRGKVALGVERTIEQDPAFALRIMVDVAAMALSPAVNAPTTAVQVLDHLEDLLRWIGASDLSARSERRDEEGRLRLLVPAQDWDEFLALAVTEIRLYGGSAVQVVRRLRAMLEELHESVRPEHRPAVTEELARLDATVARTFAESPDLDRARSPDRQGIGGPRALPGDAFGPGGSAAVQRDF
jgi:uncharacterized membrane protein